MIELLERIIRIPFVSSILRIMHPNYGTCGCCGLPWALAESHNIDMVECTDEHCGEGFFPVCEWCWQHKSFDEITKAVVSLYEFWYIDGLKHGYKPSYPLSEMLAKTRSEYERKKTIMTRKEAFNRKSKYSYYGRGLVRTWEGDYSQEQLNYLFAHGYLKDSAPMELLGEYKNNKYYEFTKTGRNWHDWYTLTKWQFFKYKIINVVWWKCMWHKLRIACGHHYDWQDYEGINKIEI